MIFQSVFATLLSGLLMSVAIGLSYQVGYGQNSAYEFPDDEYVVVTAVKANVRGTPDVRGEVVATVNQGERFDQIAKKGAWYLIQTARLVGWVHGSAIRLTDDKPSTAVVETVTKPVPRTKAVVRNSDSMFQSEYVGGENIEVLIKNDSAKNLSLTFGGAKYVIRAGTTMTMDIEEGTYDYFVSAPGVRSLSGSEGFSRGQRYRWTFYIVTY